MSETNFLLSVEDLTVSFDGFKAVDSLNLYVEKDELRVIIGPNGAGKTTLLDMICGKTRPTAGSIKFRNHELVGVPPLRTYDDVAALGAEVKRRGFKALKTNILPFDGEKLTNFGPGFGRIVADLIQGNAVGHDMGRFRLSRFSDGSALKLGPAL